MGLLRTLLAIAVVFAHSDWHNAYVFVGGRNAVRAFYMISGYLMSYILENTPIYQDAAVFYRSRAFRIYPVYFVVLAVSLLARIVAGPTYFQQWSSFPWVCILALIVSNIAIFGQDWLMFTAVKDGRFSLSANFQNSNPPVSTGLLIPPAWTLGLELTFYAIAPFILRRRALVWTLACLSLVSWAAFAVLEPTLSRQDPWTYRFFPFELSLFLLGSLSHQLLYARAAKPKNIKSIATGVTAAVLAFCVVFSELPLGEFAKAAILTATLFATLPFLFIFQDQHRFDRTIGEISYPLYLSHLVVIDTIAHFAKRLHVNSPFGSAILNVVASVLVACLLNALVAKPLETIRQAMKQREARRRALPAAA